MSPDGARVYVTGRSGTGSIEDNAARVAYDAATGDQVWARHYNFRPDGVWDIAHRVAVSPDGKRVYVMAPAQHANGTWDSWLLSYEV